MKKWIALLAVLCICFGLCACDKADYKEAQAAYAAGNYEQARALFTALGDYEDSVQMAKRCNYQLGRQRLENGKFEQALKTFEELGSFEDSEDLAKECSYKLGCQKLEDGEFTEAKEIFAELGDYEDSAKQLSACEAGEVDALLQGHWTAVQLAVIKFDYTFDEGRYHTKLTISDSAIENEGDYRIDPESKSIYICYDYIYNTSGGKRPNTEEQKLFTYTYEDGVLELTDSQENVCTKE